MKTYSDLKLPVRTLLGAGPSDVDPRVLRVMATPVVGFFDPEFLAVMDETMELTRFAFRPKASSPLPSRPRARAGWRRR